MATPGLSVVSQENLNFSRLSKLLVDGGTKVLREVFDKIVPPGSLKSHLLDPKNHGILKSLQSMKILKQEQWNKLYPLGGSTVDSQSFDITLLSLLLRNVCNMSPPSGGWNNPPASTCTKIADDIVRIRLYRNQIYGHISQPALSNPEFTTYWNEITVVLMRLGGQHYQAEIDKLKVASMDPEDEKYYIQCLKEWETNEDRIMKSQQELTKKVDRVADRVDEAKHKLSEKLEEMQQELRNIASGQQVAGRREEKFEEMDEPKLATQNVEHFSEKLKSSTKRQTEFQPKLMASHSFSRARTDDIFTNLTIQRGRKPLKKREYFDTEFDILAQLRKYIQPSGTSIEGIQKIFGGLEGDTPQPKSILVIGKPGIGKTLFCQKLVRDWANGVLFQNEPNSKTVAFDFVYLLPFRQLNLLKDEKLNLRELLNRSPFLDEHSNIDEALFEYIVQHPEKVLFVLDGYDEYAYQSEIKGNFEEKYGNNPSHDMPTTALISKLLKKKVFSGATVMVTSRPREADSLGRIHFDTLLEIAGFSPEQVKEFIAKYFDSKPEHVKNRVLEHVVENPNLVGTAHIPMMCFLLCWCLEWQIETHAERSLPSTMTELYSEVVRIFESKHHSQSEYKTSEIPEQFEVPSVVENTLENLSKLAAEMMMQYKFIFQEEDLRKFSISCQEVEVLKASGLLTCGPGLRTSPFTITRDYCFTHRTLHEYLAANYFALKADLTLIINLPLLDKSSIVPEFMAGALGRERNENIMEQLLQVLLLMHDNVRSAKCLYEYQDKEFAVKMIGKYHHCFGSGYPNRLLCCVGIDDGKYLSYLLDLLSEFNKEQKSQVHKTSSSLPLTLTGMYLVNQCGIPSRILDSLKNQFCPITSLKIDSLSHECFKYIVEALPSTNITSLVLIIASLESLDCLFKVLESTKLTHLDLDCSGIDLQFISKAIQSTKAAKFALSFGNIDQQRLEYLLEMLKSGKITKIKLLHSLYGEVVLGLQHLSQALPSSSITELDIDYRSCSDVGLEHLIKQLPSTSLTTFRIRGLYTRLNFRSLFEVLPSTGITTLDVKVFTDEDLQCLTNNLPSTNITTLCCGWFDEVSDAGLQCLSTVLPSTKITSLNFSSDYSEYEDRSDIILRYLCESLPSTNVATFGFYLPAITDKGLRYVCEALTSPKLKTLKGHCQHNCNTCSGLEDLYQALQSSTITTFELYLDCNPELMSSFCKFLPRMNIYIL